MEKAVKKCPSIYVDLDPSPDIPPYDASPSEQFAGISAKEIDDFVKEGEDLVASYGGAWPPVKTF